MTYKDLMLESLTELLEEGETLMYPIYGILNQGNTQYYGYFGFTNEYLLIALLSGKNITYTTRVPLDIKSIKIKQGLVFRQYTIDICFNDGAPCRITASPKVLMIDTQRDNIPLFLNFLKEKSPKQEQSSLKDIDGKKIRWQLFSVFIYIMLAFLPMLLVMISIFEIRAGKFAWSTVAEIISTWFLILSPFLVLAVANRFLFGKILCVINDKGMFLENDFIPWKNIKRIDYHPEVPSRYGKARFTYATFTIIGKRGGEYQRKVLHFPIYGLRRIKKHNPKIKIETPLGERIFLVFIFLFPSLFGLILSLF